MTAILIVDDVMENRYLLKSLLQGHGFEIVSAANGAEAFELAQAAPPALIVSDILMPVMDGFELCRRWKAHERLRDVPFVFYTATYTDAKDEKFALSLGADRFVIKPQKPEVLMQVVRELLEESRVKLHPSREGRPTGEEVEILRQHNEALFRKLEKKVAQLECEISERKRAEQAVRAREALLRGILDNVQDAYVRSDLDGRVTMASPSAARMFGFSFAEEMKGISTESLYADRREKESIIEEMRIGGFLADRVGLGRRRDGAPFWVSMNAQPCRDENGEIVGTEAFVREITERKKADEERQRLEEQLRTSQKLEAIGSLAGGVAHDFNNLLSVILGCTEFALLKIGEGDPAHADLQEIRRAAGRAASLTSQLLAFGRKQVLKPVPLDLNVLVRETERMLRRILGEDIDIALALVEHLGTVKADPSQTGQVIMNLAINARDAMPDGGRLTLETANVEIDPEFSARHLALEPGPYVCLAVTDTGCGMEEAVKARIFEPFFTTKEKGRGTGLGLSTVYGIVKQSGGDVWVYSEPGIGTTFKIYLPALAGPPSPHTAAPGAAVEAHGTETILVVEDEESVRKIAKRILETAGYRVFAAGSGPEALAVCEQRAGEIHLVLTDVVLPLMSGQALAERIAKTYPTIRLLFMSGYTDNAFVHQGALEASTPFIDKPFTAQDLTRKVREVLNGGRQKAESSH